MLDTNSGFVRPGQVRAGADPLLAGRCKPAAHGVAVYSAGAAGGRRLRLHAAEVDPAAQAAALRLGPITDRDEYAALAAFLASENSPTIEELNASDLPEARHLVLRLANLGDLGSLATRASSPWSPPWCWATCGIGAPNAARC